jgi:hypothetical protein
MPNIPPRDSKGHQEAGTKFVYFSFPGLLPPGHRLALNMEGRTLALLADGPLLIEEQLLSVTEWRVMLPILHAFPQYCPYEVLLSQMYCGQATQASVARYRQRLQEALRLGTWQGELRPLRRALSSLRNKLHHFGLEISTIRQGGCSLTSLDAIPKVVEGCSAKNASQPVL